MSCLFSPRPLAFAVSSACVCMSQIAVASDDAYFTALPSVLTVSRLPQPVADAPGSVTVIDREMIRASGFRYVSDLLRLVPGFQVVSTGIEPARLTYHGLAEEYPARLQVLIDGRSQYSGAFSGGVNWSVLPVAIDDIERIEVIRGSNSAAYGSNAVMGVVNIITQDAAQVKGYTVSTNMGSQGVNDKLLRWGGEVGDMHLRMTWQSQDESGISKPDSPRAASLFSLRGDMNLNGTDDLQVSAGVADVKNYTGTMGQTGNPWRSTKTRSSFAQVGWRRVQDDSSEISLRYGHTLDQYWDKHFEENTYDSYGGDLTGPVDYSARSTRDEIEFQQILLPSSTTRVVWGLGTQLENTWGPSLFYQGPQQRRIERIFGNVEWQAHPQWLLNTGATWEHNSLGNTTFSPRVNANYRIVPDHTLRFGVSRAYRIPSLYEQMGDFRYTAVGPDGNMYTSRQFLGNQNIKPEELTSYEIGYLADVKSLRGSLDVRVFREYIPDLIRVLPQPCSVAYCNRVPDSSVNAQNVRVSGFEYQLKWQPLSDTKIIYNQAYIQTKAERVSYSNPDPVLDANNLLQAQKSAPAMTTTMMIMQKLPYGVEGSVMYYHVDGLKWSVYTQNQGYQRIDYRLAYPFVWGNKRGEVSYTAQSVNATIQEFRDSQIVLPRHWISFRLEI